MRDYAALQLSGAARRDGGRAGIEGPQRAPDDGFMKRGRGRRPARGARAAPGLVRLLGAAGQARQVLPGGNSWPSPGAPPVQAARPSRTGAGSGRAGGWAVAGPPAPARRRAEAGLFLQAAAELSDIPAHLRHLQSVLSHR
ncbi:hypothetical protein GCM10027034_41230 [Ramlibacter solisilvae]